MADVYEVSEFSWWILFQEFVPIGSQFSTMKLALYRRHHGVGYGGTCCRDARLYTVYASNVTTIVPASTPCIPGLASLGLITSFD